MGNVAVAGELAGSDERDELYKLSGTEPEPEDDEDEDQGEDEEFEPDDIPHG